MFWIFHMELPNEAPFPLSKRYYDHCKNVFYSFSEQQLSGKHIPSSKSCNLLVQTVIEKMESSRERLLKKICFKAVPGVNC